MNYSEESMFADLSDTEQEQLNHLAYQIRGLIFKVFKQYGPGLLEKVYETALFYELTLANIPARQQESLPLHAGGVYLPVAYKLDLIVDDKIIIEVKSVETLMDVHKKQLLTYLRLKQLHLGILVNFKTAWLKDGVSLIRIVN